jgi:hypothetical protein
MSAAHKLPNHILTYAIDCAQGKTAFDGALDAVFVNTKTWAVTVRDAKTGHDTHLDSIWDLVADVTGDRQQDFLFSHDLAAGTLTFQLPMSMDAYLRGLKPYQQKDVITRPAAYSGGSSQVNIRADIDRDLDGTVDARAVLYQRPEERVDVSSDMIYLEIYPSVIRVKSRSHPKARSCTG